MGYILIVDDNTKNITSLELLLAQEGYPLQVTNNGQDALTLINQSHPELILLDIMMPDMDGIEVCKRIQQNPDTQHIPIIFLTALIDHETREQAFEAGARDYITKPFHHGETRMRVRNQLQIRQSFREIEKYHQQEKQYLQNLLRIQEDFVQSATHDLKNPLAIIVSSIYLIRRFGPSNWGKVLEKIANIEKAIEIMKTLVVDVLEVTRIETEKPDFKPVDIGNLLVEVITDFESMAQKKGISLSVLPFPLPQGTMVIAGRDDLVRVFSNLISNAIKYSPSDTTVKIRGDTDAATGQLTITVQDEGYGIPPDDLDKIFDRFYRVSTKKHQQESGTGLGLYIVKALVERNGGGIKVESELDVETKFAVTLPTQ